MDSERIIQILSENPEDPEQSELLEDIANSYEKMLSESDKEKRGYLQEYLERQINRYETVEHLEKEKGLYQF